MKDKPLMAVTVYLKPDVADIIKKQSFESGLPTGVFLERMIEDIYLNHLNDICRLQY